MAPLRAITGSADGDTFWRPRRRRHPQLRATAAGSTYALSCLSNALLPFILLPVLAAFGPVAMFAVVSAAMVIVALDIGLLGPRSTGRDLESVNTAEAPISG